MYSSNNSQHSSLKMHEDEVLHSFCQICKMRTHEIHWYAQLSLILSFIIKSRYQSPLRR